MQTIITLLLSFAPLLLLAQNINTQNITIARDQWGVPHIFSQTDEEAVYGLAWAHAEDNFEQIQEPLLVSRNLLGSVTGKDGALFDAVSFLIDADNIVAEQYEQTFSPSSKKYWRLMLLP